MTRSAGRWTIIAVFILSRLAYFGAGLQFNALPVSQFWQMIDVALMRTDLLRSLWYLHMQPPGYNLAIGLLVKLFPQHYRPVLWVAHLAMGVLAALLLYELMCWFGVPRIWSCVLTCAFLISPGTVLFEDEAVYEYAIAFLLLLAAALLARFCERGALRWSLAFFGCLLILEMTRNAIHIIYVLCLTAALWWIFPRARIAIAIGAMPALLVPLAVSAKNALLFGRFTTSTWMGMTLGVVTSYHLTPDEASRLIGNGTVSPFARIPPFSGWSEYAPLMSKPPKTGIAVLDEVATSTGHPNFNALAYLPVHDRYQADAIALLRRYPIVYARSVAIAWFTYFLPSSDVHYFDKRRDPIARWDRIYSAAVAGRFLRADSRKDLRALKASGHTLELVLYTGLFLALAFPVLVGWGIAQLAVERYRRRWTTAQVVVLGFLLFTIVFLAGLSNQLSTFECNRYRFPVDGFYVALLGMMMASVRGVRSGPVAGSDFLQAR